MPRGFEKDYITFTNDILKEFCIAALESRSVRDDVLHHVVESLIQTSLRGVDSHGIGLLPHYIRALDSGRINPDPKYCYMETAQSTGKLDADHTFGHAAGFEGMTRAIEMARKNGVGAVSVYNSTHFGAAAYFSLLASKQDMIGISFTHADSLMLSYLGTRPFFGTNPICFSAPCENEDPFCLDMATSLVSWNKILMYRTSGEEIPSNWACDAQGEPTTNSNEAVSLLPIGNYKGFGLSMMIDILCSLLSGMPFGRNISRMYTDPVNKRRYLGHFFLAVDITCFTELSIFKKRLKEMMEAVRNEQSKSKDTPVMVPGDPEKKTYAIRIKSGIPVSKMTYESFKLISKDISFKLTGKVISRCNQKAAWSNRGAERLNTL